MFERFTERARQVIVLAQDNARNLKHDWIGTEHIVLGLLAEEHGMAARVLASFDVTLDEARKRVAEAQSPGDEQVTTPQIPFTPRAKHACELALREALSLGHNYIGTEHILLAIVRMNDSAGMAVLRGFDVDGERIRAEVLQLVPGPFARKVKAAAPVPDKLSLTLSREAVEWLAENAGGMPHSHVESREVYEAAMQLLRLNPSRRVA